MNSSSGGAGSTEPSFSAAETRGGLNGSTKGRGLQADPSVVVLLEKTRAPQCGKGQGRVF